MHQNASFFLRNYVDSVLFLRFMRFVHCIEGSEKVPFGKFANIFLRIEESLNFPASLLIYLLFKVNIHMSNVLQPCFVSVECQREIFLAFRNAPFCTAHYKDAQLVKLHKSLAFAELLSMRQCCIHNFYSLTKTSSFV